MSKRDPKSLIMGAAFAACSVLETLERIGKGEDVLEAIGGGIERGRIRAREIRKAATRSRKRVHRIECDMGVDCDGRCKKQ